MILNNVRMAITGEPISIRVHKGKIVQILPGLFHDRSVQFDLDLKGGIIFPGLINSHDHLDFNNFPALGDRTYKSYTEWGKCIHTNYKEEINKVLKIPAELREKWGIYKNLLCGVTTVVNHGKKMNKSTDLITIFEDCHCIHSVQFEKKWKLALNNPLKKNVPVVIHIGEGIDPLSLKEIDKLTHWNLLRRNLVGVHGVSLTENQAKAFKALVWCPESNCFLLGQTAPVDQLKKHIPILFGTDSTLTGSWNIWEHIRLARKTRLLSDQELYDTFTSNPANTWQLEGGTIAEGKDADLVIAKAKTGLPNGNDFFETRPEDILMVIHQGIISLFDEELYPQLNNIDLEGYSRIHINGTRKYVKGSLPELMLQIKHHCPEAAFPVS